jgi:hypothetical protein
MYGAMELFVHFSIGAEGEAPSLLDPAAKGM